jgi:hypothetical protein
MQHRRARDGTRLCRRDGRDRDDTRLLWAQPRPGRYAVGESAWGRDTGSHEGRRAVAGNGPWPCCRVALDGSSR